MKEYVVWLDPCRFGHRSVTDWVGQPEKGIREMRGYCERCGMVWRGWEWTNLGLGDGESVTVSYTQEV